MSTVRLSGSDLAADIRAEVTRRVASLRDYGRQTRVAIVTATNDDSSAWYVQSIRKACGKAGIEADVVDLGPEAAADTIWRTLANLSSDNGVSGIILQTPLPAGVDVTQVASGIDPAKDIDGASALSIGRWSLVPRRSRRPQPKRSCACLSITGSRSAARKSLSSAAHSWWASRWPTCACG